ncbi:non-functional pseudokinase ZED1-like [Forsythia ovata]|uniref:Non-functional pseudokinase ZED1-like n=1 Tax=Forsythia ovata TaxID=205694 RepID=A0ABD1VMA4_9LAMI
MIGRTPGFNEDVPPGTNQPPKLNGAINDIVITSQMGHLKYVLKLIGCRLEFKYPGTVYKDAGNELLTDLLYYPNSDKFFPWKSRLKVATDIAYVVALSSCCISQACDL